MSEASNSKENDALPISVEERDRLFDGFERFPLALCVSGGADSMALMHLVAEWASATSSVALSGESIAVPGKLRADFARPKKQPVPSWLSETEPRVGPELTGRLPRIVVLTVDHGLRPEAVEEAEFVAAEAARLGLPHQVLTSDQGPPDSGIQEWARDLRHRLIVELLEAESWWLFDHGVWDRCGILRHIVMAHHLDDQVETVLMRLARGSGLRGLGGMYETQPLSIGPTPARPYTIGGLVRRPFLAVPKSRLVSTLRTRGGNWVDDPTNDDERFERVRIRKAVRLLRNVGVGSKGIALSAERLRAAEGSLDGFEEHWRRDLIGWNDGLFGEVPSPKFHERGDFSCVRLLMHLLTAFGGASRRAELAQVERLRELLIGAEGPFKGATLGGCRIQLEGKYQDGRLVIYREGNGHGLDSLSLAAGQCVEWDGGRFQIEADRSAPAAAEVRALGSEGWAWLKQEVEGLDDLKLKAAAMATLPAIWQGHDLITVPFFASYFATGAVPQKVERAWTNWQSLQAGCYKARFTA